MELVRSVKHMLANTRSMSKPQNPHNSNESQACWNILVSPSIEEAKTGRSLDFVGQPI